jgi:hypothetical protein
MAGNQGQEPAMQIPDFKHNGQELKLALPSMLFEIFCVFHAFKGIKCLRIS